MTSPRIIDHMCPTHVWACRIRWPIAGDWQALCGQCASCRQRSSGLSTGQVLPDFTPGQLDQVHAIHEAGHAVAALARNVPLASVEIWRDGEDGKRPDGGYTDFGDTQWVGSVSAIDRFTALWAGQEATDRWLTEMGLGTNANRLDVRFLAWHDARLFEETVSGECLNVPSDWGVIEARDLVAAEWKQVTALAAELVARRWLSGDEVRALLSIA